MSNLTQLTSLRDYYRNLGNMDKVMEYQGYIDKGADTSMNTIKSTSNITGDALQASNARQFGDMAYNTPEMVGNSSLGTGNNGGTKFPWQSNPGGWDSGATVNNSLAASGTLQDTGLGTQRFGMTATDLSAASGGLGNYGTLTDSFGRTTDVGKGAFDAMADVGGPGEGFTLAKADTEGTDWGMEGYGGLALGAGNLGLGIASYLDNKKTADIQRNLLNQKYASNAESLADRRVSKAHLNKAFGTA